MRIINGNVLVNNSFEQTDIEIENGIITVLGSLGDSKDAFDASGCYVIPGFIDTHIHGCVGVEFASDNEDFTPARVWLASEGVTSFAATVRSMQIEDIVLAEQNILREMDRDANGATVEGINIEGPFVSFVKSGVMSPPDIKCDKASVAKMAIAGKNKLKIMTIAPERENALEAIKTACEYGVNVSIGHTDVTYEQAISAIGSGASRATHLFNAMRSLSHRESGVLGAVLTDGRVNCELICDLVHVDAPVIKMAYKLKGAEGITLVSDTGVMSGLGDGEFVVNGKRRVVKDGVCRNEQGRIAGSCVSMLAGARNLLKMGIPLSDISVMASKNPAKALGIDDKVGVISLGKRADIVVCDSELNIKAVFVKGNRCK